MAKRNKNKPNSRPKRTNKNVNRQLTRLYTGIPAISRKNRSDPKPLPTHIDMTIRVLFSLQYWGSSFPSPTANVTYSIAQPTIASNIGNVQVYYHRNSTIASRALRIKNIQFRMTDFIRSAQMRLFGRDLTDLTDTASAYLKSTTDYAIQSVSAYGPLSQQREQIKLQVDFNANTPGVTMTDVGDRLRRAALHARASRLYWTNQSNVGSNVLAIYSTDIPVGATGQDDPLSDPQFHTSMGLVEAVVLVRRSFIERDIPISTADMVTDDLDDLNI